jgi:thymidylate synthase
MWLFISIYQFLKNQLDYNVWFKSQENLDEDVNIDEQQYLDLVKDVIKNGTPEIGRNGPTLVKFGNMMKYDLKNGTLPVLTTKKVAIKTCINELFWFIRGSTSNDELNKMNVKIWNGNSTREFLDSRGLKDRREGDLGPVYGFQWRFFNAPYNDCNTDYTGKGKDQLQQIIDNLKNPETRTSRRHILTAWNPAQLDEMALPPCHMICQFHVREDKYLSCALFQRSGDIGLGVPFNIASYSVLTHLLAHHCSLEADEFVHFIGNGHIYTDHVDQLKEQVKRIPKSFPKIIIQHRHDNINDYCMDDIKWINEYKSHGKIPMIMSV